MSQWVSFPSLISERGVLLHLAAYNYYWYVSHRTGHVAQEIERVECRGVPEQDVSPLLLLTS